MNRNKEEYLLKSNFYNTFNINKQLAAFLTKYIQNWDFYTDFKFVIEKNRFKPKKNKEYLEYFSLVGVIV